MQLQIRAAAMEDAATCGQICYDAFAAIAGRHGFPPELPSLDAAVTLMSELIGNPGFFGVVAECEGRVVGSNFLDERSMILGVGPISVEPTSQDRQLGRALMTAVLDRSAARGAPGVRLVQIAYHNRSLSLYTKLGFDIREPLAALQGTPLELQIHGYAVRRATEADIDACNALCVRVLGHDRKGELVDAIALRSATVVERQGRISGYATGIGYFTHSVAETNDDLAALIAAAEEYSGPGFLVPLRNTELLRWCLQHGLRVVHMHNLMSIGLYQEPRGAFLPSIFC
ncbi:acetyltransferase [Mycobacterium sp. 1164966.3]|uniref:GNAT family N-acetyltransferase n=1 Tax=Mycobacterium sp. 1164966.3 TaxID=1856861 RepID=UPI0007FDDD2B|nr:GNAT family N-acetyltransferase [Mycobacterium sp. 1164966.3]OBA82030.1 acetyltransferase [Mycobacterium sp. 1164966.3]